MPTADCFGTARQKPVGGGGGGGGSPPAWNGLVNVNNTVTSNKIPKTMWYRKQQFPGNNNYILLRNLIDLVVNTRQQSTVEIYTFCC